QRPAAMACVACWIMAQAVAPPRFIVAVSRRSRSPSACCSWNDPMPWSFQVSPGFTRSPSTSLRVRPASSSARRTASTGKRIACVPETLPGGGMPSPAIAAAPRSGCALIALALEDTEAAAQQVHLILHRRAAARRHEHVEELLLTGLLVCRLVSQRVEDLVDHAGNLTLRDHEVAAAERPGPV